MFKSSSTYQQLLFDGRHLPSSPHSFLSRARERKKTCSGYSFHTHAMLVVNTNFRALPDRHLPGQPSKFSRAAHVNARRTQL